MFQPKAGVPCQVTAELSHKDMIMVMEPAVGLLGSRWSTTVFPMVSSYPCWYENKDLKACLQSFCSICFPCVAGTSAELFCYNQSGIRQSPYTANSSDQGLVPLHTQDTLWQLSTVVALKQRELEANPLSIPQILSKLDRTVATLFAQYSVCGMQWRMFLERPGV